MIEWFVALISFLKSLFSCSGSQPNKNHQKVKCKSACCGDAISHSAKISSSSSSKDNS